MRRGAALGAGRAVGGRSGGDWALGHAAVHARFAEADLASILDHHARTEPGRVHQAREQQSLTQGTAGWAALGRDHPDPDTHPAGEVTGEVAS